MGTTCSDLKKTNNPCEIGQCIEKIKSLNTNSSYSKPVLITFKEGTKYDDKEVKQAFMKIFISLQKPYKNKRDDEKVDIFDFKNELDPDRIFQQYSTDVKYYENFISNIEDLLYSISYESEIYSNIITPLLEYKICPNYVSCYSTSLTCSFSDMVSLLANGTLKSQEECEYLIFRMYNNVMTDQNKPLVSDIKKIKPNQALNLKYGFIINEPIVSITCDNILLRNIKDRIALEIYFQLACACYGLALSKTNHNDLHLNNIYIIRENSLTHYNVNQTVYSLETNYFVKIFDYDRAYCPRLGNNAVLFDTEIMKFGQSNTFHPMKDIWKITYLYLHYGYDVLRFILKDVNDVESFLKFDPTKANYLQHENGTIMDNQYFDTYCCSLDETIYRVAKELELVDRYKEGEPIYNLDKRLFLPDGTLQIEKLL